VKARPPLAYYAAYFAGACLRRTVAYLVVVYGFEVLGGGIWSGLFYLCLVSPYLLSVYAGSVIDASSKRSVLQFSSALPVPILALLAGTDHLNWFGPGAAHGWLIAALIGGYGIVSGFNYPAFLAAIPDVVDRAAIGRTAALVNVLSMLSYVCGPLAAGLLRTQLGWSGVFAALAAGAILAWAILWFVPLPERDKPHAPADSEWGRLRALLAHCRKDPGLFTLIVASVVFAGLVVGPLEVLGPLFAKDPLGYPPLRASLFMAAGGIGLLVGAIGALWLVGRGRATGWLGGCGIGGAVLMLGMTVAPPWAAFPLFFLGGLVGGVFNSFIMAQTQVLAPDALRGRVLGLFALILGATPALTGLATGALVSALGTVTTLRLVFTSVIAAFSLYYFTVPRTDQAGPRPSAAA
jgi:predicted MFS family arabinose efflux permease